MAKKNNILRNLILFIIIAIMLLIFYLIGETMLKLAGHGGL